MFGVFPRGPIREKLAQLRGPTLKTIVRLHTEGYHWLAVVVDERMRILDWWEARSEHEAREKAKGMLDKAKTRRPELGPYTMFLIETSRFGEKALSS